MASRDRDDWGDDDRGGRRDRQGGGNALLWVLLAGAVVGTLCVGLAGVGFFLMRVGPAAGPAVQQATPTAAKPAKYTRDEFRQLVEGKTTDEVIKAVGKPTSTSEVGGEVRWYYEQTTYDPVSGQVDMRAMLVVERGTVTQVNF